MAKGKSDIQELDDLNRHLIKIAKAGSCEVSESIAIFNGSVKYLAVKNKIEPDGDEGDGWKRKSTGFGGEGSNHPKPKKARAVKSASATSSGSADSQESGAGYPHSDDGVDLVQGPRAALGSFPLPVGSVHTGINGSEGA